MTTKLKQQAIGNIDATSVNGYSASSTPTAGKLLALDTNGKFPVSVLPFSKTTDTNGWTVYDYGNWKEYSRRWAGINPGVIAVDAVMVVSGFSLPVGKSPSTSLITISGSAGSASTAFIYTVGYSAESTLTNGTYNIYMRNVIGATPLTPTNVSITITIKDI